MSVKEKIIYGIIILITIVVLVGWFKNWVKQ